jgi:hypothetical protein
LGAGAVPPPVQLQQVSAMSTHPSPEHVSTQPSAQVQSKFVFSLMHALNWSTPRNSAHRPLNSTLLTSHPKIDVWQPSALVKSMLLLHASQVGLETWMPHSASFCLTSSVWALKIVH